MNIDKMLFKYVEKFYEIQKGTNCINNKLVNSDYFAIARPFFDLFPFFLIIDCLDPFASF